MHSHCFKYRIGGACVLRRFVVLECQSACPATNLSSKSSSDRSLKWNWDSVSCAFRIGQNGDAVYRLPPWHKLEIEEWQPVVLWRLTGFVRIRYAAHSPLKSISIRYSLRFRWSSLSLMVSSLTLLIKAVLFIVFIVDFVASDVVTVLASSILF